jgi:hypothetical protein
MPAARCVKRLRNSFRHSGWRGGWMKRCSMHFARRSSIWARPGAIPMCCRKAQSTTLLACTPGSILLAIPIKEMRPSGSGRQRGRSRPRSSATWCPLRPGNELAAGTCGTHAVVRSSARPASRPRRGAIGPPSCGCPGGHGPQGGQVPADLAGAPGGAAGRARACLPAAATSRARHCRTCCDGCKPPSASRRSASGIQRVMMSSLRQGGQCGLSTRSGAESSPCRGGCGHPHTSPTQFSGRS